MPDDPGSLSQTLDASELPVLGGRFALVHVAGRAVLDSRAAALPPELADALRGSPEAAWLRE